MIQFTQQEVKKFIEKLKEDDGVIHWLTEQVHGVTEHGINIPETGIGTWGGYYFCKKHSTRLIYNPKDSEHHVCPVDGEALTDEQYTGSWWNATNGRNSRACHHSAILWMLTGEKEYLEYARTILTGYARFYPSYEVHGQVPYNEPGKVSAQAITDAGWVKGLVFGYDIVKEELSQEERSFVEKNLFAVCGEFLMEHRTDQLHNHEVVINSAIAMIGVLLGREDMIEFSVYGKYGLRYQLENAVFKDFLWFEGTLGYHFFTLGHLMSFEKFAVNTPYSLLSHPNYLPMLKMPIQLLQPDFTPPALNDTSSQGSLSGQENIYEFAYKVYGDKELGWLLHKIYGQRERDRLLAFLYGADRIPEVEEPVLGNFHSEDGCGLTVFRGKDSRYLLVKHSPYGGEHDHYDRLGILFSAYGRRILPDLATTGYSAPLHYGYYKNTGSHNTVVINESNQPPANPVVLAYSQEEDYLLLDVEVRWDGSYKPLDSFVIPDWDEESYRGVSLRRIIAWYEDYFIEIFKVDGVKDKTIDWVLHAEGSLKPMAGAEDSPGAFSSKKPFNHLKNMKKLVPEGVAKSVWYGEGCNLCLYSGSAGDRTLYYGEGPGTSPVKDISYIIQRTKGESALFVNVFEAFASEPQIEGDVRICAKEDRVEVQLMLTSGEVRAFSYEL